MTTINKPAHNEIIVTDKYKRIFTVTLKLQCRISRNDSRNNVCYCTYEGFLSLKICNIKHHFYMNENGI